MRNDGNNNTGQHHYPLHLGKVRDDSCEHDMFNEDEFEYDDQYGDDYSSEYEGEYESEYEGDYEGEYEDGDEHYE